MGTNMFRSAAWLPPILLGAALASTAAASPGTGGSGPAAIVGGGPTSEFLSTGGLLYDFGDGSAALFCSATLILPRVALTAAHCLLQYPPTWMYFGTNPFDPEADGAFADVAGTLGHEDFVYPFATSGYIHDIALVYLADDAPVAPVSVRFDDSSDSVDWTVTYVGFGTTEGTGVDGSKRAGRSSIDLVERDLVETVPVDGWPCFGDSGGSAYLQTASGWELMAVISYVYGSGSEPDCGSGRAGAVRTDLYADWIEANSVADGDDDDDASVDDDDDDASAGDDDGGDGNEDGSEDGGDDGRVSMADLEDRGTGACSAWIGGSRPPPARGVLPVLVAVVSLPWFGRARRPAPAAFGRARRPAPTAFGRARRPAPTAFGRARRPAPTASGRFRPAR
jgi:hypothetical protein